jgi:hypothetical protein
MLRLIQICDTFAPPAPIGKYCAFLGWQPRVAYGRLRPFSLSSRENATQRGNSATAITGSVAAALRLLAKVILIGDEDISRILEMSQKALETARGQEHEPDRADVRSKELFEMTGPVISNNRASATKTLYCAPGACSAAGASAVLGTTIPPCT